MPQENFCPFSSKIKDTTPSSRRSLSRPDLYSYLYVWALWVSLHGLDEVGSLLTGARLVGLDAHGREERGQAAGPGVDPVGGVGEQEVEASGRRLAR